MCVSDTKLRRIASDDYGTTFAGTGKVCDKTLTPNVVKADRLRNQKFW